MSNILENFYAGMQNVVLRASDGKPSVFVRFPKQKSSDFDSTYLPNTTHPAFMCGEGVEDDAVLIGKYISCELSDGSPLYSLPNQPPQHSLSVNQAYALSKYPSEMGVVCMTIADFGLIACMHHKAEIGLPYGNNFMGSDVRAGQRYTKNMNVAVGDIVIYCGWKYKCKVAHTTSASYLPTNTPSYWERLEKVGGTTCDYETGNLWGSYCLTGSGPADWFMFGDPTSIDNPSTYTIIRDCRIVAGEIQLIPYNKAADPSYIVTEDSEDWRAILPNANDNGYTFVAPGTEGTVHYKIYTSGSTRNVMLLGRALEQEEFTEDYSNSMFKDMMVDTETLPYVPSILYELGLAPIPGTKLDGLIQGRLASSGKRYVIIGRKASTFTSNSQVSSVAGLMCIQTINSASDQVCQIRLCAREASTE